MLLGAVLPRKRHEGIVSYIRNFVPYLWILHQDKNFAFTWRETIVEVEGEEAWEGALIFAFAIT